MASTAPERRARASSPGSAGSRGDTLIEGIKAAGVDCPTRKAFINNLRLEKGYTGDGFFDDPETKIDFAKVYGKPFLCVYYVHVENKQFVPQFGGKPFCAKQADHRQQDHARWCPTTTAAATATTDDRRSVTPVTDF